MDLGFGPVLLPPGNVSRSVVTLANKLPDVLSPAPGYPVPVGDLLPENDDPTQEATSSGARRVLLIDDDPDFTRLMSLHYLPPKSGYEIVIAPSITTALTMLQEPWDIILTDLNLQPFDGLGAIRAIKTAKPMAPVIVLTSSTIDQSLKLEAVTAGAESAVAKTGLTPEGLQFEVSLAMRRWRNDLEADRTFQYMSASLKLQTQSARERASILELVGAIDQRLEALDRRLGVLEQASKSEEDRGLKELLVGLKTKEGRELALKTLAAAAKVAAAGMAGGTAAVWALLEQLSK